MKILLIEDDKQLSRQVSMGLRSDGFEVDQAFSGSDGVYMLTEGNYDAAVIDWLLPEVDGKQIVKRARAQGIVCPVIIATALGQVENKLECFEAGADDYVVKPFDVRELSARIKALLRRPNTVVREVLSFDDIKLDMTEMQLIGSKGGVGVTQKEAELLEAFLTRPGHTLTRELLFSRVWGIEADTLESALDIYVHYLRRHLSFVSDNVIIKTTRGVGYKLTKKDV